MPVSVTDIPDAEIEFSAIRASGPGGQNVNKVSTAIHLRFDVRGSSLPRYVKDGLLALNDARVSSDGVVVIKAQRFRSQDKNKEDALARLDELLVKAQHRNKTRRATKPTKGSVKRRLDNKKKHGQRKQMRKRIDD